MQCLLVCPIFRSAGRLYGALDGGLQVICLQFELNRVTHSGDIFLPFLACLDKVQEELLYYPGVGVGGGVSKMLKFYVKVFYVMGKALSGELSCPCDRPCCFFSSAILVGVNSYRKEYAPVGVDSIL